MLATKIFRLGRDLVFFVVGIIIMFALPEDFLSGVLKIIPFLLNIGLFLNLLKFIAQVKEE